MIYPYDLSIVANNIQIGSLIVHSLSEGDGEVRRVIGVDR